MVFKSKLEVQYLCSLENDHCAIDSQEDAYVRTEREGGGGAESQRCLSCISDKLCPG